MLSDFFCDLKSTPSAYLNAARQIEAGDFRLRPVNVAILSTSTVDLLRPYLIVEGARRGMLVRPFFAPFNQLEQQVLDSASLLYESRPDIVVIAMRVEEIAPKLLTRFVSLSPDDIVNGLTGIEARLQNLVGGLRRLTTATILVFNYACPQFGAAGLADASLKPSRAGFFNVPMNLWSRFVESSPVFTCLITLGWFTNLAFDAGTILNSGIWDGFPSGRKHSLKRAGGLRVICVLSVSNPVNAWLLTLTTHSGEGCWVRRVWEALPLGEKYPGNVYKDLQRALVSLRDKGVLLAVASKNNEPDALEVFQKHPDCILKVGDFAALRIDWRRKRRA